MKEFAAGSTLAFISSVARGTYILDLSVCLFKGSCIEVFLFIDNFIMYIRQAAKEYTSVAYLNNVHTMVVFLLCSYVCKYFIIIANYIKSSFDYAIMVRVTTYSILNHMYTFLHTARDL